MEKIHKFNFDLDTWTFLRMFELFWILLFIQDIFGSEIRHHLEYSMNIKMLGFRLVWQ